MSVKAPRGVGRRILLDLTPLRRSRDYRALLSGLGVSVLGNQLMGVQMAVVAGGPRLGDLESGAVATAFGDTVSVVSGGLACVAGALVVAWALPGFTWLRSALHAQADDAADELSDVAVQPELAARCHPGATPRAGVLSRPVGALTIASTSSAVSLRANSPVRAAANSLSVSSLRVFS